MRNYYNNFDDVHSLRAASRKSGAQRLIIEANVRTPILYTIFNKWRDKYSVLRLSKYNSHHCYTYHPVCEDDDRPYLFYRGRELNWRFYFCDI